MRFDWLGDMFEGDSTGKCTENFQLVSMGGRADRGERTPIRAGGILDIFLFSLTNVANKA